MKKLYYLLSLCLAFVSIAMPAYADGGTWSGKGIKSVGDAATEIEAGKYYLMHNTGRSWWIAEGDGVLTGISVSSDDLTSTNLTTAFYGTTYMSSVVYVGGDTDAYTFQFQSGNYMGVLNWNSQASTSSTAETFTIGTIEDSYFTILDNTTVEYTYWSWDSSSNVTTTGQQYLDGNETTPIGWNSATTTTGNGANGAYQFFEVTLVDVYTVTYNLKDSDGNTISTKDYYIMHGDSYPDAPTSVDGLYTISSDNVPTGEVTKDSICNFTVTYESNPAFTVSSSTDAATWYGIVTRGGTKYLATNDDNSYIDLSTTWKAAAGSFDAYANVQNNRLWCIMGNPFDGFELYNKYAGKYISMSNTTNGTSATMVSTSSDNTKFDIVCNSSNYLFKKHGSDNAFLSDYADKDPNTLRMWNSASALTDNSGAGDAGSIMKFVAAEDLEDLTAANIPTVSVTERVSSFNFWKDGISSMTETGEELYNAIGSVDVETGKYYQFVATPTRNDGYLISVEPTIASSGYTSLGLLCDSSDPSTMTTIFSFETSDTESLYYIKHANSSLYIGPATSNQVSLSTSKDDATTYTLKETSTPYYWSLAATATSGNYLNRTENWKSEGWADADMVFAYDKDGDEDAGSSWYIVPIDEIPLTIYDDTQYASANYPFAVTLPDGLTAYVVSAAEGDEATLTEIGSQTVPKQTAVFITAADGTTPTSTDTSAGTKTYTLTISTSTDTYNSPTLLKGTTIANSTFSENENYVLASNGTEAVLKKSGTVTTIPANKAYLPAAKVTASVQALYFNFGKTSGIEAATTVTSAAADAIYYDLNGRRVFYPAHGIFVKANGQKVYVK